jgi:hypothetical protein
MKIPRLAAVRRVMSQRRNPGSLNRGSGREHPRVNNRIKAPDH